MIGLARRLPLFLLLSSTSSLAVAAGSAAGQTLPGAAGPRLQLLLKPPQELEIVDVFVYAHADQAAANAARPNRFPAGTTKLTLDIRVKELRRMGTIIRFEVETTGGRVEIADGLFSFARLEREGVSSMDLDLVPKRGVYADGPYQLKLYMNDILVAILNWQVA
jgi:hypothetical protein